MTPTGQPHQPPVCARPPVVLHPHVRDLLAWAFSESDKPFVVREPK